MTLRTVHTTLLALLILMPIGQVSAKNDDLPETTVEGLVRVPDSKLAIVYADPAADLSAYDSVMILEPYVAFKKNWARNQRSAAGSLSSAPKPADIERMKTLMASEFTEVFGQVLSDGGYTITEQSGESVLLVRPAIIDLDPAAPEVRSSTASRTYVRSAGEMSMYIELYDSLTGDLIAKALDRRADSSQVTHYTWANPATNAAASRRILRGWAKILLDALDEARQ
jgi:hypothetical protein